MLEQLKTIRSTIGYIKTLFLIVAILHNTAEAGEATFSGQMLSLLQMEGSKSERNGSFDEAVSALKRAGYIHRRHDAKEDYAAIWKILKPLMIYGNRVLVISNEEEGEYIGCCMQDRTEILMEANGDIDKLRDFAKQNHCLLYHDDASDQERLSRR